MPTKANLDLLLDEELAFILNYSKDFFNTLDENSIEYDIANGWLVKICCEEVDGIRARQTRNLYLIRLVECFQACRLIEPFKTFPKPGPLEPFRRNANGIGPSWFKDLIHNAAQRGIKFLIYEQFLIKNEPVSVIQNQPDAGDVTEIQKFIIDAIESELSGDAEPGACRLLEDIFEIFTDIIIGTEVRDVAATLSRQWMRNFCLFQMHCQFLNDLSPE